MERDATAKLCKAVSQILSLIECCGQRQIIPSNLKHLPDADVYVVAFPVEDITRLRELIAKASPALERPTAPGMGGGL